MPHNKNTDRVVKRILPWIILLGLIGLTSYIFLPNASQYAFAPNAIDNDSLDSSIIETILFPEESPSITVTPPLKLEMPPDSSVVTVPIKHKTVAATPEPSAPADDQTPPTLSEPTTTAVASTSTTTTAEPSAPTDDQTPPTLSEPTTTAVASTSATTTAEPSAPTDDQTPPALSEPTTKPDSTTTTSVTVSATSEAKIDGTTTTIASPKPEAEAKPDTTPPASNGEFVKRLAIFERQKNYWQYIRSHNENPTLIGQLKPLRKLLSRASLTRVEILYSDYVKDGNSNPDNSKIIAVRGTEGNKTWLYYARFEGKAVYYYDYDGNAPEPSMDRAPLRYTRITSHFNPRRRHPISGRIRPHNGVDFKAAYGANIHSTGNGIVTFAGWQHGYGRIVIIKHPNGYETRYAHLSAISVTAGQSIKRGQVVGKLGNSGISTGHHLHYEVRINGVPKNPMTISLPSFKPIARSYLDIWHFRAEQYQIAMKELAETGYTSH